MLKIASWNVNSLRVRLDHLQTWLNTQAIDVLMLQEIKCEDTQFPLAAIHALGYQACYVGQKSYNGVACLSREVLIPVFGDTSIAQHEQKRFLAVVYQDILIINLYVPNGQAVGSEKYRYKISWLTMLLEYVVEAQKSYNKIVIVGDYNIAPSAQDHASANFIRDEIMRSPQEQAIFQQLLDLGFHDSFRYFHPQETQYTWWDYRIKAFEKNLGYRIDHILVSEALLSSCIACDIDKSPRELSKPSDHAPIILTLDGV